MSVFIANCFLIEIATESLGKVYARLIGNTDEHPHYIGKFIGKVGLLAGFGRLVAITACHDASHLAHLLGEYGHIGQFAKVAHTIGLYPFIDLSLSLFYSHTIHDFASQYISLPGRH